MKLTCGLILMVLGIIGIARGSVGSTTNTAIPSTSAERGNHMPLAQLASSMLFVGGLIVLAKTVPLRVEDLKFRAMPAAQLPQPGPAKKESATKESAKASAAA